MSIPAELDVPSNRKAAIHREIDKAIHAQIGLFRTTGQKVRDYRIPFNHINIVRVTRKLRKELDYFADIYKLEFYILDRSESIRFQIDLEQVTMSASQATRYHEALDFIKQKEQK